MPISRIQQARVAAGLSLQQVIDRLPDGLRVSRAAVHKYEAGTSTPSARMLMHLAKLYAVSPQQLLGPPVIDIEWVAFRRHRALSVRATESIKARARSHAERQLRVEQLIAGRSGHGFPAPVPVRTPEQAEACAAGLRTKWRLGEAPIESLTETVESQGGVVVDLADAPLEFHGLSGRAHGDHPVVVVQRDAPADRRRFTIAHELGHLCMSTGATADAERLAHRFASAFLLPAAVARRELGETRRSLGIEELLLLKRRYGVSVQAWLRRAKDLDIISPSAYTRYCKTVSKLGWRKAEPVVYDAERTSSRLEQLIRRALAEGVMSRDEARELLPDLEARAATLHSKRASARDLMRRPAAERDEALLRAAEKAAPLYESGAIERFEAFGEGDLRDDGDEA